ncbi:MAG: YbaB/EbfC family nucleoid-associated protein [Acidimicrobiia bacterium]|nr:YbaB/EbfC family nucleoid-associated protein [Acidimicrobiia bacterium]
MSDQNDPNAAMPDLGALLGGGAAGGMPDLGGLMEQAQAMLAGAQEAAAEIVEGSSGGGMVKIEVDGNFTVHSVSIDPSVVDPNDVEMLNDLVLAALRDASSQLQESQSDAMGGMDLGGLGGLLGGG